MKVVWSFGATEAKVPEIVDAIVDMTETGSTLRAHGMKIIETLLTVAARAGRQPRGAEDPAKRAAMEDVTTLLLGALRAEGRADQAERQRSGAREVLKVVPSMKSPTVSPLSAAERHRDGGREAAGNTLIPQLKAAGATDILEIPISKIVP